MPRHPQSKYAPFPQVDLPDRQWPNRRLERAPIWCSVDLRDGNQALAVPMSVKQKVELFTMLVDLGFKEIEVGFPSASNTEFTFCRKLIEDDLIPDDVSIQVLVQAREHLIRKTFDAIAGAPSAIVHVYNSTNPLQRRVTFNLDKPDIRKIAVDGTTLIRELAQEVTDTRLRFQYSPESFSDTELPFALEVCEAVYEAWQPREDEKIIFNLPATVEMSTPNIHADQIEWFCRNFSRRDRILVSLHTHNDRGTGVAATELGLMAGADRVEGTLFGNGERTGNLDIVTVALNLYTQGVDPHLDFSDLPAVRDLYERVTRMPVHDRHPYAGDLVFTAFSGSHQDAIKKGMDHLDKTPGDRWEVPYLPIDPEDIGRTYRAIIRINSQSGKGGVAYILQRDYGFDLPKKMHGEFGEVVNAMADRLGCELTNEQIRAAFSEEYLHRNAPLTLVGYTDVPLEGHPDRVRITAEVLFQDQPHTLVGEGNGPINAFVDALQQKGWKNFSLKDFRQHAISEGSGADAAAYIEIERRSDQRHYWGVGVDANIERAGLKALISAVNRAWDN